MRQLFASEHFTPSLLLFSQPLLDPAANCLGGRTAWGWWVRWSVAAHLLGQQERQQRGAGVLLEAVRLELQDMPMPGGGTYTMIEVGTGTGGSMTINQAPGTPSHWMALRRR